MLRKQNLTQIFILLLLLGVCRGAGRASGEMPVRFGSDIIIDEIPPDFQSGSFVCRITIRPDSGSKINQVALHIKAVDHLTYSGPLDIVLSASPANPAVFELPFEMVNLDTAGIKYHLDIGNGKYYLDHMELYWISRADSAQRYTSNPREWARVRFKQAPVEHRFDYDSIQAQYAKIPAQSITGFVDDNGKKISKEEWKRLRRIQYGWPPDYEPPDERIWQWTDKKGQPIFDEADYNQYWLQERLNDPTEIYDPKEDPNVVIVVDSATGKEMIYHKLYYRRIQQEKENAIADAKQQAKMDSLRVHYDTYIAPQKAEKDSLHKLLETPGINKEEAKKQWKERKPLDKREIEYHWVDSVLWVRTFGESKFRIADRKPSFNNTSIDSSFKHPTFTIWEGVLDLRTQENFKIAKEIALTIRPTDSTGYYWVAMDNQGFNLLVKERKISFKSKFDSQITNNSSVGDSSISKDNVKKK